MKIKNGNEIPTNLLNTKLCDMKCKHVLDSGNIKAKKALRLSNECGYRWCLWGSHDEHDGVFEYHLNRIVQMEKDNFQRPIRIVICSYPFSSKKHIWIDNLHSAIYYIRKYGKDVKLRQVNFYVVDISEYNDIIYDYNGSLIQNPYDIADAIECAYYRRTMSNSEELIKLDYRVEDFISDNPGIYTMYNSHLGLVSDEDNNLSKFEKMNAFNSLWEKDEYLYGSND